MNDAYKMTKDNLMRTFPAILAQDEGMRPLGVIVADALEKLKGQAKKASIYPFIDQQDEDVLDALARDMKVDWYDYNQTLRAKHQIIKDEMQVHRTLGTIGAVRRALKGIFDSLLIQEWPSYGGDPYHFRVIVGGAWTPEREAWARRAINLTKNLRSVMDALISIQGVDSGVLIENGHFFADVLYPMCGDPVCGGEMYLV